MKRALLDRLAALKLAGVPVALITDLSTGMQTLLTDQTQEGGFGLTAAQRDKALRMLAQDRSGLLVADEDDADDEIEGAARLSVAAHNPPLRLVLVGAVHIAQVLAPMAALAGYAVTVIDPRRAFAADARFPGVTVDHSWPDEGLAALGIDSRTAVVTLSHDPKLDDPALITALRSPAFYVGALGSRRTQSKRLERLRAAGLSERQSAGLHAPVGLEINAVTPAEIAVAILAQITAVLRRFVD
jgi:xanthine dehydrogenase accessory factor